MSAAVDFRRDGDCLWVTPRLAHAEILVLPEAESLKVELEKETTERVIVDLSHLAYFGSTVLDLLVFMWRKVARREGQMVIYNPSPLGREVLSAARLDQLWPIVDSRDEAVRLARV